VDLGDLAENCENRGRVYDFNKGSGRVLTKLRCEHITTLKCAVWKDGKLAGLELWGMVRKVF
jgi:hypothetical protein